MTAPALSGGCQCGAVRYEVRSAPLETYVCHCTECRRQSSSAFGISVYARAADLTVVAGAPTFWTRPGRLYGPVTCAFCPTCGTRLWHVSRDDPEIVSLKGGSLDQAVDLAKATHVWTRQALPGVVIPATARRYAEEPDGA